VEYYVWFQIVRPVFAPLGRPFTNGGVILEQILKGWVGADWMYLVQDWVYMFGSCEHSNECSSSMKYEEFLKCLRAC
jgi:hypothetical protein